MMVENNFQNELISLKGSIEWKTLLAVVGGLIPSRLFAPEIWLDNQ